MRLKDTMGLTYILGRTELKMRKKIDQILKRSGITSAQYSVLAALEEEGSSATNAELARHCFVTPQTMNRMIQLLERDGFLQKDQSRSEGGLKLYYRLTSRGEKTVCKAHAEIFEIEKKMSQGMSKADIQKLKSLLGSCCDNLLRSAPQE